MAKKAKTEQQVFDFGLAPSDKPNGASSPLKPLLEFDAALLTLYNLAAPTVCWPGYEAHVRSLEWVQNDAPLQRLLHYRDALQGFCSEQDAMVYLHTVSLALPFDHHWARIYGYLFRRVMTARGVDVTAALGESIVVEKLDPHQEEQLRRLRRWIFNQQMARLKERLKRRWEPPSDMA